ncbi:hypothetical protein NA56DRAFT_683959 [Hyaloscypha hepaticicola]|uniref:Uncharacterized protein n=1 Tax=Hyaloscypha hepaticicola TaxID=2082293 RepID=A0A2J6QQT9_9HELO|nr:hypothetical protein NA56DRAFT_683959 [Hyaloscypha hepaticicola]
MRKPSSIRLLALAMGIALPLTSAQATNSTSTNPNVICRPAKWTDVVVFYLGNYVAHAATTLNLPGQSPLGVVFVILAALFFPISGVFRGFRAISTLAIFAETELQTAARAGALCMVVELDDRARYEFEGGEKPIQLLSTKIHGSYELPGSHGLRLVPHEAKFEGDSVGSINLWEKVTKPFRTEIRTVTKISCSYSLVKAFVALGQTLFAITTLYQTKGDELERFGFAAFGLTVAPYAFMSVINLFGNLVCPEYPAMYLVESEALRSLRAISAPDENDLHVWFDGVVGKLAADSDNSVRRQDDESAVTRGQRPDITRVAPLLSLFLSLLVGLLKTCIAGAVPLAIIGGLSGFRTGSSSTYHQRVWTMTWLGFGIFAGGGGFKMERVENRQFFNIRRRRFAEDFRIVMATFLYAAPAIGGFVVVGQMILESGVCIEVG